MKNRGARPIIIAVLCIVLAMMVGTVIYKQAFAGKGNTASVDKQTEEAKASEQPSMDAQQPGAAGVTATPSMERSQEATPSETPKATMEPKGTATPAASEGPLATGVTQSPTMSASATNPANTNQPVVSHASTATANPTKHPGELVTTKPATAKPTEAPTKKPTVASTKKPTTVPTKKPTEAPTPKPVITEAPKAPAITFTIDASVIGNGTYVKNAKVELKQGETAAATITRGLKQEGFGWSNTGSIDSTFYLQAITKANLVKDPAVPQRVLNILEENDVKLKITKYKSGSLGEFDFTKYSGWRYSVNGTYANVGMSEYELKAGDHVLLKYTLCLGYDA
ncbi:MAG: DUF4430 domain-containing protein [bacterium]|nr:DUF4430 domain-containing protein [bacterium]